MRKNELLHLHALLELVRRDVLARGWIEEETLGAYDELGISPKHAHRSKHHHEEAVMVLSALLADALSAEGKYRDDGDEADPPTPDANR